tara:strand:- start:198 stop:1175 length:978 start_codon:yes stop_codon:yes gene_type:complete
MKGLKKIALVTAIAAAPFAAHADLKALDDSTMGNVTGQAGVTIELETRVSIGEFTYKDEGTFAVSGIELGGSSVSSSDSGRTNPLGGELLDNLKIDIDIADDGDAIIHVGSLQTYDHDGDPGTPEQPAPIDWGMTAQSMELRGNNNEKTTLISNLDAWGNLGALDIRVDTDDVAGYADSGTLNLDAAFTVEEMSFNADFLALGVSGMSIKSSEASGAKIGADGLAAIFGEIDPDTGDVTVTAEAQRKIGLAQAGFAIVSLDVYKGNNLAAAGSVNAKSDVLRVDVTDVLMDINIAETTIGGTNIGTIGIDNLHISDTRLAVYGKD